MFHKYTSRIAATLTLMCLTAQPITSYANEPVGPAAPATQAQPDQVSAMADKAKALLGDRSFYEIRQETEQKMSETQEWVKDHKAVETAQGLIEDLGTATDKLQTRVAPVGESIKTSFMAKSMKKTFAQRVNNKSKAFGLLFILAFAFVIFLMGMSRPMSRLGGRH